MYILSILLCPVVEHFLKIKFYTQLFNFLTISLHYAELKSTLANNAKCGSILANFESHGIHSKMKCAMPNLLLSPLPLLTLFNCSNNCRLSGPITPPIKHHTIASTQSSADGRHQMVRLAFSCAVSISISIVTE